DAAPGFGGGVARDSATADRQRAEVGDAAADVADPAGRWIPRGNAIADGQAGQRDLHVGGDFQDTRVEAGADGQLSGARALDVQALVDEQLPAGQRDALAPQTVFEGDGVAALRVGDLIAQRAGRGRGGVQVVGDGQRAGHVAAFEDFDARPEARRRG